jgi:hypothetical protein
MLSLLLILIDPLGHASTQSPQPLQSPVLIRMNPFFKGRSPDWQFKINDYVQLHTLAKTILGEKHNKSA